TTTTTTSTANLCKGNAICAYDTVTEVIDGDTLNTQQHGTVRLALVNTPEKGQDGYDEAKEFLTDICFVETSSVLIDQDDRQPLDNFGRIVAKVFCGELNANEEIYYGAYGEINTDYCGQSEFASEDWAIDGGC
ncbi:MAG TPA: thermonuclease family protein, partial [archaeon]|nr:thermonuclease family protein [archaeon]